MKKALLMAIVFMLCGDYHATVSAQEIQLQEQAGGRLECLAEEGEEATELTPGAKGASSYTPYIGAKYSLTYTTDSNGVKITGYSGDAEGNLIIPAEIDGATVYAIGYGAFRNCSGFTGSLSLPAGITSIGYNAFYGCSGFTGNLELPESLTSIENYAFGICTGFTGNLSLPAGLTSIGNNAFYGCTGFTGKLELREGLTSIGDNAFRGCSGFNGNLILPEGLTSIGNNAFYECSGFTGNLELPEGLTSIGNNAFRECSGFTGNLILPEGLTSIGSYAFYGCTGFTGSLELPEGLTSIGDGAFRDCTGFTGSLKLKEGLTSIGNYVFYGCNGFAGSLELPEGLTSIGNSAFYGCNGFTGSLELPEGLTSIGDEAFRYCSGFTGSLELPADLTRIGIYAFDECIGFTSIVIPNSLTGIGDEAFRGCYGVTGISIPAGMVSIGAYAFDGCRGLANVYFGGNPRQWASIAIEYGNEPLMNANIYYNTYYASADSMPALTDNAVPTAVLLPSAGSAESRNLGSQEYSTWADTVKSYLYDNGNGLTRVEYTGGKVVVENYDSSFQYQSGYTLEPELPVWGGFYAGEEYNFLIFGQNNPEKDDSLEVIRVVKYDKNWNRLSHASLKGANTTKPFHAGSLRCAEYGGMFYVRTCHEMYNGHQANLTFSVRLADMKVTDHKYDVTNLLTGYVSHSFNQFLLVDADGNIVALDHGDAYPRAATLVRYEIKAGKNVFTNPVGWDCISDQLDIKVFPGSTGLNETGASLGGLAETETGYLAAYSFNQSALLSYHPREIYISYIPKENISQEGMRTWSSASAIGGTPVIASMGAEGGYVLWNNYESGNTVVNYVRYDAQGNVSQIQADEGLRLSDCQPIIYQGKVVWYVTDNSTPAFYSLPIQGAASGADGLAQGPDGGWYYYRNGVVDTSYNGLAPNGADWWYVENGAINFSYTGLVYDPYVGWWYIENGMVNFGYNGLIEYGGAWWCVAGGAVAFDYTGLWSDPYVGWWYVENGMVNFGYNGLIEYGGAWWCVAGGAVIFDYTGLWCDPYVGWWYVENGMVNFGYNGLIEYGGAWWCVAGGTVAFDYTGLWCDPNLGWWYVESGCVNFGYTGPIEYGDTVYQVVEGMLVY